MEVNTLSPASVKGTERQPTATRRLFLTGSPTREDNSSSAVEGTPAFRRTRRFPAAFTTAQLWIQPTNADYLISSPRICYFAPKYFRNIYQLHWSLTYILLTNAYSAFCQCPYQRLTRVCLDGVQVSVKSINTSAEHTVRSVAVPPDFCTCPQTYKHAAEQQMRHATSYSLTHEQLATHSMSVPLWQFPKQSRDSMSWSTMPTASCTCRAGATRQ